MIASDGLDSNFEGEQDSTSKRERRGLEPNGLRVSHLGGRHLNRGDWGLVVRCGWFWWLSAPATVIATALVLEFRAPDEIVIPFLEIALPTTCWTRRWLGWNCPGCGLTRSFVQAAHGDVSGAMAVHPMGTIVFGLLLLQLPLRIIQGWRFFANRRNGTTNPTDRNTAFVEFFSSGRFSIRFFAAATAVSFLWWCWNLALGWHTSG